MIAQWVQAETANAFNELHLDRLRDTGDCENCDLRGADLTASDFTSAKLNGADLRDARLAGSNFTAARLRGADLRGVALYDVRLLGADLRDADLRHLDADVDLEFIELTGVLLEGARFKHGVICGKLPTRGAWGCLAAE